MSDKQSNKIIFSVVMISLALALRQMSMTIVAPFLSTYCVSLTGYTSLLAGVAVGIFGLMQAFLQIPFGMFSDRYGNKRVLLFGLTLVISGFVLGFFTTSIWMLIIARVLQGSGAIIGVGYSWVAGLADNQNRTKAMSILGVFISTAAALAFAIGPLLRSIMPLRWMFMTGAILLTMNTLYILIFLKDTKNGQKTSIPNRKDIVSLLKNRSFVTMNIVAFLNNFMMMSVFFAAPIYMDGVTGQNGMWKIFIPAIIAAIIVMKLMGRWVAKGYIRPVLLVAFMLSAFSIVLYFYPTSFYCLLSGTMLYLCGYITIATTAATYVNQIIDNDLRGTANGIFNSFQYIGNFIGALIMGMIWGVSQHAAWWIVISAGLIGFILLVFNRHASERKDEVVNER